MKRLRGPRRTDQIWKGGLGAKPAWVSHLALVGQVGFAVQMALAAGTAGRAGAFLRVGIGAEPMALGGAMTAASRTVYAASFNPAALVSLSGPQFGSSYALLSLDRKLSFVGFAAAVGTAGKGKLEEASHPRPPAAVGLAWIHAGVGEIDGRDLDGRHTATLSSSENAFLFAFALKPHRLVALGLTGKVFYSRFPGVKEDGGALSSQGFGVDLGMFIEPGRGFAVGLCAENLNAHYTWNTQGVWEHGSSKTDYFPRGLRLGLACHAFDQRALALAQIEKREDSALAWAAGLQWAMGEEFLFRAGIRRNRPALGLGVRQPLWGRDFRLEYAFFAEPESPQPAHWVGWRVDFGRRQTGLP
ncbi:MAG: hypothetical protein ONB23_09190 [candidate division KSB1 bacterium]|nr:hypothetical protein [candidate division KSB1 bacterium]